VRSVLGRGLYAIVDAASLARSGLDLLAFARAVLVAAPAAIQLRAKALSSDVIASLLEELAPMCAAAGVPLVMNDRVDLAVRARCPWVHVGQEDVAVAEVRRRAPGLLVGVSTHTPEQLSAALDARPDYVAYGPVFPTTSKVNPDPCVGAVGLASAFACARSAGVPLVAIGGVTLARAPELEPFCTAAAAIDALLPREHTSGSAAYEEVTMRAQTLHAALLGREREATRA
jgi:thiamine-phosphate pyrophosphorylase